jgi:hypothetical protein
VEAAVGLSQLKGRIARQTGIPTTRGGIERKVRRPLIQMLLRLFSRKECTMTRQWIAGLVIAGPLGQSVAAQTTVTDPANPNLGLGGPSWVTVLGHAKDSLWSLDRLRRESAALRTERLG